MKKFYLIFTALTFICGILLSSFGFFKNLPLSVFILLVTILFSTAILFFNKDLIFISITILLVFLLGAARYTTFNYISGANIKNYIYNSHKKVFLKGRIVNDPETKETSRYKKTFVLEANSIKESNQWRNVDGFVLVNIYNDKMLTLRYGDKVILEGILRLPRSYIGQANFDYRKYLERKRIYATLSVKKGFLVKKLVSRDDQKTKIIQGIYSLREKATMRINKYLTPPYNSILIAMLLGKRSGIPKSIKDSFIKTGTLHILAISGLHIGIIYFALITILKILGIKGDMSRIISILLLICYAILAGGRPSVVRATTMFSILALGEISRRKISIFNSIGLSFFIILMINPNQIFDTGFILSYAAVVSIIIISPILYDLFFAEKTLKYTNKFVVKAKHYLFISVLVSISVWIGLMPIMAYYFGIITPIVVLANLIVIPLLLMAITSGILLLSFGLLSGTLSVLFAQSAWFFLFILTKSVNFLKSIPLAYIEIKPPGFFKVIIYYSILSALFFVAKKIKLTF